jgi:DNA polymerase-1
MSSAGVPIDADSWREHARKTEADAARLEAELNALTSEHPDGKAWNFGSHQQVRKAAKLLGVDIPDTKDETLALYAKEHEFIATLRDYRKVSKLASTYGAGWLENGYHQDGRIYASWRQLQAATGRMACDHPNLQNIPRSGPLRSYIRAPEGRVFVVADYSQIELRIAAKVSGDQEMLSAYAEGRDLHTLTAQNLTRREDITNDDRKLAKAVNFGLLYGMGATGLQSYALKSYGVEMSSEEASLYRKRFFRTYPGLKTWHDNERRAWHYGGMETRTLTGRRRTNVESLTDRLNAPVQGTAADGLKLALALLWASAPRPRRSSGSPRSRGDEHLRGRVPRGLPRLPRLHRHPDRRGGHGSHPLHFEGDPQGRVHGRGADEQGAQLDGDNHRPHRRRQDRRELGQLGRDGHDAAAWRHPRAGTLGGAPPSRPG